ncbi:MAG: hypothetical protein HY589_05145, partial [Candidatus Omnitrophica bacterium]|nr:hypothetical protein [Candidatus Omnitrophota bacterium]
YNIVRMFLNKLNRVSTHKELRELKRCWKIDKKSGRPGKNIGSLMGRIVKALPENSATDTFSPGTTKAIPPIRMPEVSKRYLDELLKDRDIVENIRSTLAGFLGVDVGRITYKVVSSDDKCRIGWGAGPEKTPFGRMPRDGGYAVKFYVNDQDNAGGRDGWEMPFAFMWIRESLTEIGNLRPLGYDIVDISIAEGMDFTPEQRERLNQEVQAFMETEARELSDIAFALAVKEVLNADPKNPPAALAQSIASLPPTTNDKDPFDVVREEVLADAKRLEMELNAELAIAQQELRPIERVYLDKARVLYIQGNLSAGVYRQILQDQIYRAITARAGPLIERISMYIRELESGQYLTTANPYPALLLEPAAQSKDMELAASAI